MSGLKYKVGDRVRIKSLDWYNENKDEYGYIDYGTYMFFPCMSKFCGKTFEIAEVYSNCYKVKELCAKTLDWTDEMIEGLVEEETKPEPKFKVGDILFYRGETCGYLKVEEIREENGEIRYYETSRNLYLIENSPDVFVDKVCSVETEETKNNNDVIEGHVEEEVFIKANDIYNEEYSKGEYCHEQSFKWGFQEGYNYSHENDKLEISLKEGYQFKDENGNIINATKIVLEKKKKEYPKTYEECTKVLLDRASVRNDFGYKGELLVALQKLLVCRDAYWKIAGEEMGLGKPWEPSGNEGCFVISRSCGEVYLYSSAGDCDPFEFPTPEMRDAFKENFDKDLEFCKELL